MKDSAVREILFSYQKKRDKAEYEFEERKTPEAKFARVMDNFQPVMLNAATDGRMWAENGVHLEKILKRNEKTHEGSEMLWKYMYEHFILPNVKKGRIKE